MQQACQSLCHPDLMSLVALNWIQNSLTAWVTSLKQALRGQLVDHLYKEIHQHCFWRVCCTRFDAFNSDATLNQISGHYSVRPSTFCGDVTGGCGIVGLADCSGYVIFGQAPAC